MPKHKKYMEIEADIDEDLYCLALIEARREGISVEEFISRAVTKFLDELKVSKKSKRSARNKPRK